MDGCWTSAQKPKEKVKHQLDRYSKTHWEMFINFFLLDFSGVVPGGAGDAMTPPEFGRSVNPISTRRTDYAHLITTGTPGFPELLTVLKYNPLNKYSRIILMP